MRPLLCLLLCLITTATLAQEPPALIVTKAGFYYVVTDTAGVPQLVRVTKVISVGDGGPNIPLPPGTPTPPPANPVREEVAAIAREVNHPIGAKALSLVYSTVLDQVEGGQIPLDQVWPAIKAGSDAVLKAPGVDGAAKWFEARKTIGDLVTAETQAGRLSTKAQVLAFGRAVSAGLAEAAPADAAIDPEFLKLLLEIILRAIQLLFGPQGPV